MILVRQLHDRAETRQQHARAARSGDEVRVAHGAYVRTRDWEGTTDRERCILRLSGFAGTRKRPPVFSHWSAASLHGLPLIGAIPDRIHVTVGRTGGGRSARGVVAHSTQVHVDDIVEVDGMRCTSLLRTVVDLAATAPTADAVVLADHALRTSLSGLKAELLEAWLRAQPMRGHRRSLDVIALADGRAESPLESVSRVNMQAARLAEPDLQTPFADGNGRIGFVDFAWPSARVIGEADGEAKYLDPALRGGRTADRVVLDEKIREDRLRALGWRVVRWRWSVARDAEALGALLTAAGVPRATTPWRDCASAPRRRDTPGLQHWPRSGKLV